MTNDLGKVMTNDQTPKCKRCGSTKIHTVKLEPNVKKTRHYCISCGRTWNDDDPQASETLLRK